MARKTKSWWPHDLGHPNVYGSSDGLRYAYLAAANCLAVDDAQGIKP